MNLLEKNWAARILATKNEPTTPRTKYVNYALTKEINKNFALLERKIVLMKHVVETEKNLFSSRNQVPKLFRSFQGKISDYLGLGSSVRNKFPAGTPLLN